MIAAILSLIPAFASLPRGFFAERSELTVDQRRIVDAFGPPTCSYCGSPSDGKANCCNCGAPPKERK